MRASLESTDRHIHNGHCHKNGRDTQEKERKTVSKGRPWGAQHRQGRKHPLKNLKLKASWREWWSPKSKKPQLKKLSGCHKAGHGLGVVVHAYNPNTEEVEAERFWV